MLSRAYAVPTVAAIASSICSFVGAPSSPGGGGNGGPPSTSTSRSTNIGQARASSIATQQPIEWPTTTAEPPYALTTSARSAACRAMPYGPGRSRLFPRPRRSAPTNRWSVARSSPISRKPRWWPVIPCAATTSGPPSPHTPTANSPPATGTLCMR
jgi:hypothetical protein